MNFQKSKNPTVKTYFQKFFTSLWHFYRLLEKVTHGRIVEKIGTNGPFSSIHGRGFSFSRNMLKSKYQYYFYICHYYVVEHCLDSRLCKVASRTSAIILFQFIPYLYSPRNRNSRLCLHIAERTYRIQMYRSEHFDQITGLNYITKPFLQRPAHHFIYSWRNDKLDSGSSQPLNQ